ncbi:hypothetical protein Agabi119p4_4637 [Agaricus bisporus var. burnettii]|uniref:RlpA-like protein double-psi beta-barrel domain-containing protein n=1 Tax=Agaricus bisporus var. burnettii TaxID=192524 RepID=A0A8H7F3Z4_AGABI|nr:hypothetical protein Agabi119p4_4637 [Agaricus bisporus var. burnettii]
MHALSFLLVIKFVLLSLSEGAASQSGPVKAIGMQKYTRPHSYGNNYTFDERDGWQTANFTEFMHAHVNDSRSNIGRAFSKEQSDIDKQVKDLLGLMKGVGSWTRVTTTWYTGDDLKNPSCWQNTKWAPTDGSFACALTLEGWLGRPKCFTFLELCNGPKKCIFVRVIDTCAGCARGSKHVDLTKSAFRSLADLDRGRLDNVRMRPATHPDEWYEELWGPKHY